MDTTHLAALAGVGGGLAAVLYPLGKICYDSIKARAEHGRDIDSLKESRTDHETRIRTLEKA